MIKLKQTGNIQRVDTAAAAAADQRWVINHSVFWHPDKLRICYWLVVTSQHGYLAVSTSSS